MRNYLKQQIDKFNQEFSIDKPLDIEEFERLIGEIRDEPWKYPEVIQFLRDNIPSTEDNDQVV